MAEAYLICNVGFNKCGYDLRTKALPARMCPTPRNISLIGYRATGKSTLGNLLARRIGFTCVDTDDEVEQRAGQSIADIFRTQGESAFRELEAEVIREFTARSGLVLSLGGGAILRLENRDAIGACGPVIWLQASADVIAHRISVDPASVTKRPALTDQSGLEEVRTLLAERTPLYEACASIAIDTNEWIPDDLVEEIVRKCGL